MIRALQKYNREPNTERRPMYASMTNTLSNRKVQSKDILHVLSYIETSLQELKEIVHIKKGV